MIKAKKKRVVDPDMPVGKLIRIPDFLPPPEKLIFPEPTEKVTLFLTQSSIDFFKRASTRSKIPYQRMIREVVDQYAKRFKE